MTALTPAFKAIQERITKSLIPIIIETLDEYIAKHNAIDLSVVANTITKRMNKRYHTFFHKIPFQGKKLEEFMKLPILGMYLFNEFYRNSEIYINDDYLFEILMNKDNEYLFEKYKALLLCYEDYSDDEI